MGLIRCTLCREKFSWDLTKPFPDECPLCRKFIGSDRADDEICLPSIKSMKAAVVDQTYREIERTSELRAQQAAEMAGVPVSEMSGLKITNLRDNQREGDVAAVSVNNAVTQAMDAINARGGQVGWQGSNGVGYSGAVQTGAYANAGAHFQGALREYHGRTMGYDKVGERPALETQQPGYRSRV